MRKVIGLGALIAHCMCWSAPLSAIEYSGDEMTNISLEQAIQAVVAYHPAVSGKRAEVSAKEYMGDIARAARYPSLTTQTGIQNNTMQTKDPNTALITARVKQPIWAFGRIEDGIAYADEDVRVNKADLLRVQRDLLEQTVVAYANVQGIYAKQKVLQENIEKHEEFYAQISRREKGALASAADVNLASLRLIQAKAQKKRLEGDLLIALNELQALIQIPVEHVKKVPTELTDFPVDLQHIEQAALDSSANILHKRRLVTLAERDSQRERSSAFPTINVQAERNFNQIGYLNGNRYSVTMDAGLEGMGFSAWGKSKAALARQVAAEETLKVARNELLRNIRSLLKNRQIQQDIIKVQQDSVKELEVLEESYYRQYEVGHKAWLEVLNIQRELTDQKVLTVQAQNDWLLYTLRAVTLMGGFDHLSDQMQVKR
ncbi:MAG: TolC family protein [Zetaproteobacteria bacterium]|nr:TolC family protein [Zetaproteobacteria bacterium]